MSEGLQRKFKKGKRNSGDRQHRNGYSGAVGWSEGTQAASAWGQLLYCHLRNHCIPVALHKTLQRRVGLSVHSLLSLKHSEESALRLSSLVER